MDMFSQNSQSTHPTWVNLAQSLALTVKAGIVAVCVLLPSLVFAQAETPESLAKSYIQALSDGGMGATAEFMHPDALADFKGMLLPVYNAEARAGERQLIDITFGQEVSVDQLSEISDTQFFRGFLNLIEAQTAGQNMQFDKIEVLGTVTEAEVQHVLTRMSVGSEQVKVTSMEVLSFIPYQDTWRLRLTGEIEGMARALQQSLSQ